MTYHSPAYAQKLPASSVEVPEPPSEDTNPYGTFLGVVAPFTFPLDFFLLGVPQVFINTGSLVYL